MERDVQIRKEEEILIKISSGEITAFGTREITRS
jgi:hypothetical protein